MNKFAIAASVVGIALFGSSIANAAESGVKSTTGVDAHATDFSAKKKKHHSRGHHHMRDSRHHRNSRWSHRYNRRHYGSYAYGPGPYYRGGYDPYYRPYGGPGVTFSFGGGRW